jgi:hypothetical protein
LDKNQFNSIYSRRPIGKKQTNKQVNVKLNQHSHLLRSIIHQHIQLPKLADMALHQRFTVLLIHQITRKQIDGSTRLFHQPLRILRIDLFLRQIGDGDTGATFASELDGNSTSDTAISPSDNRGLAFQPKLKTLTSIKSRTK